MYLTWFDSNSWLIELGGKRILIDPWLVDSLVFSKLDWLFKGSRRSDRAIPENIDLIVLSQGLEDHAHPPTLKLLDRAIPVVASLNAARVVRELDYTEVTALQPGETFTLDNRIEIKATPGSQLGPTLLENGYLLKELATGITLYYEPHGFHAPIVKEAAPVDVVITPIVDLTLPLVGSIIKGTKSALEVAQWLQPQVMLPTAEPGEVEYAGMLTYALRSVGSIEDFRSKLVESNLSTQAIEPKPGDRMELELKPRTLNNANSVT
jgi:L-ascorbate metabolism protein UlaG (beta-lactamase superfamily)